MVRSAKYFISLSCGGTCRDSINSTLSTPPAIESTTQQTSDQLSGKCSRPTLLSTLDPNRCFTNLRTVRLGWRQNKPANWQRALGSPVGVSCTTITEPTRSFAVVPADATEPKRGKDEETPIDPPMKQQQMYVPPMNINTATDRREAKIFIGDGCRRGTSVNTKLTDAVFCRTLRSGQLDRTARSRDPPRMYRNRGPSSVVALGRGRVCPDGVDDQCQFAWVRSNPAEIAATLERVDEVRRQS